MLKRFVKRLLSCLLLAALFVLVVIGGTLGVQGWRLYRATAAQKPIASLYDEISSRPGFASCDQLPQTYIDAVISVEDSRFERRHGIDPAAIVRALWADLRTRSLAEGGSTLTQQLAKNELFTQEKQMARKAAEMFAARDIEDYYSKQQIFEMYAGSCYFGNQWSGVAQAAQGYFGKPTRELTRAECVVLAGLPNAPSGCAGLLWQAHPGADPRRVCGTGRPAQRALSLRRQRGAGPQARSCGGGADGARQKADPHPGTGASG